jgi:hypothetical protein
VVHSFGRVPRCPEDGGHGARRRAITEKNGGALGAAKFREETSKKQTARREPHCCGAQCKEPTAVATRGILRRLRSQPGHRGGSLVAKRPLKGRR